MKKMRQPRGSRNRRKARQEKPAQRVSKQEGRRAQPARGRTKLIARFLVVGLLNTAVGYGIYGLFVLLRIPYLAALLMATVMGVVFNYFSTGKLVFKSSGGRAVFAKFIAAYGLVYAINATALDVLIKQFHFGPYIGQALCVPVSVLISWLLMNYWVYSND